MKKTPIKILVVDDEPDLHPILRARLGKDGFAVLDAYGGEQALRLVDEHHPELVIIDVVMPGMNGFEVCKAIKKVYPQMRVIIYTAKVDAVDAGKAKEAGAELFTVKTQSLTLLLASIRRILEPK